MQIFQIMVEEEMVHPGQRRFGKRPEKNQGKEEK